MDTQTWKDIEAFIRNILTAVYSELDIESIAGVEHYLRYDEYEMAFEILFAEIMKRKETPEVDLCRSRKVAGLLTLNTEAVFDIDFWKHFESFTSKQPVLKTLFIKGKVAGIG